MGCKICANRSEPRGILKSLLITGATGFIGRSCITRLVERGFVVHAVSRSRAGADKGGAIWHQLDLFDEPSVECLLKELKAHSLLHLAWETTPGEFWNSTLNLAWLRCSLNLFEQFRHNGGTRIVATGTCAEYDWKVGGLLSESSPIRPGSLYGVCKNALREVFVKWSESEGLEYAWARLFFLYGPGEQKGRFVRSISEALLNGQSFSCRLGSQRRDYLYVDDASEALVRLLEVNVSGTFNVASGESVTMRDFINELGAAANSNYSNLLLFEEANPAICETQEFAADTGKIRKACGWAPTVPTNIGIRKTLEWYQKQKLSSTEDI